MAQNEQVDLAKVRKAAEHGDTAAQCILGSCFKYADGVEEDAGEAAKWFRIAAENGNALAQQLLGLCYMQGEGIERDFSEAGKWYRKAAEQGNAEAQSALEECYVVCDGAEMTLAEAAELSRLRNEVERAKAEFKFSCYAADSDPNSPLAMSNLRWAASLGHPKAQFILGRCFEIAQGVERNPVEAERLYRKAAANDEMDAQLALGVHCFRGDTVKKNIPEAAMWLRKASDQGHAEAKRYLELVQREQSS